jgi:hypothetical protein
VTDDLRALQHDLGMAVVQSMAVARVAVQHAASEVKRKARDNISGHATLPAYPYSITYDTRIEPYGASAAIGPDKGKAQGPLGNILEYGTSSRAPMPHLAPALDSESAAFEQGVSALVEKLL